MAKESPRPVTAQEQFGRQARLYVESVVHRQGENLDVLVEWAAREGYRRAADVGAGIGFTAFAVAPYAERVVATDLTPAMLREARNVAAQRGLSQVRYALAAAEALPFADGALELVTCRQAAHHFTDVGQAVAEWRRVLAPRGVLLLADTTSPEDPAQAEWMHDIEVRRDPSHVRDLAPSAWLSLLRAQGLQITDTALTAVPLEFDDWVRRSGTPSEEVQRLRRDFQDAPGPVRSAFHIRRDSAGALRFQWDCLVARAVRQP
jgi:SAM-dependent methyltransferase